MYAKKCLLFVLRIFKSNPCVGPLVSDPCRSYRRFFDKSRCMMPFIVLYRMVYNKSSLGHGISISKIILKSSFLTRFPLKTEIQLK